MAPSAITLPRRSLIALCGPAGSGKSTFAAEVIRCNDLAPPQSSPQTPAA